MEYYFSKTIQSRFNEAINRVTAALKTEGFGVITEIDISRIMTEKLSVPFRNYRILGACNPAYAYKALQAENKIGTMLPCNVIVQELDPDLVEIAAIDPQASMQAIENPELVDILTEIHHKLERVVNACDQTILVKKN